MKESSILFYTRRERFVKFNFCAVLLPRRQVATMLSRCESVLSVHLAREVLWDVIRTRHTFHPALVQDYLSENYSFSGVTK